MHSVNEGTEKRGTVALKNERCIPTESVLELLHVYLNSIFADWDNDIFIQRQRVCIGSCITPMASDIFLANVAWLIADCLQDTKLVKCF